MGNTIQSGAVQLAAPSIFSSRSPQRSIVCGPLDLSLHRIIQLHSVATVCPKQVISLLIALDSICKLSSRIADFLRITLAQHSITTETESRPHPTGQSFRVYRKNPWRTKVKLKTILASLGLALIGTISSAAAQNPADTNLVMPITNSPSAVMYAPMPSFNQQLARFQAEQMAYRLEAYNWAGYSPLRPNVNASYMSSPHYAPPHRGYMTNFTRRGWYW